jgi:hypothetical protein
MPLPDRPSLEYLKKLAKEKLITLVNIMDAGSWPRRRDTSESWGF